MWKKAAVAIGTPAGFGMFMATTAKLVAAPADGVVTGGAAEIIQKGSAISIHQTSDRAIIDWKGFSIGAGERVDFSQPTARAAVLNRVTGSEASDIRGTLTASGRVFLMNPNGIVIGASGVIDTNGFVGTTGTISDSEFLAGKNIKISGAEAGISNAGHITARQGDVVLVAREIRNTGAIRAGGSVALGAGTEVLLSEAGDGHLSVRVGGEGSLDQAGTISAARVELKAAGGNAYGLAINHSGVTRATGAVKTGGKVILTGGSGVKIGGKIQARGGKIGVQGKSVEVASGASIDASGRDGGSIRIGGRGTTERVTVASGAKVAASASGTGRGGRVDVWSEIATLFSGDVSVAGGTGGFAEISSAGSLEFTGHADLTGRNGGNGTLLLDPTDMVIDAAQAASIVSTLGTGNVVIATSANGPGAGDMTVSAPISYASANDLTLLAHGNLRVNATVKNDGTGKLTGIAGWDGSTQSGFTTSQGSYGNGGGSIMLGSGSQTSGINFASRFGDTFLGGSILSVMGGSGAGAYAQAGWTAIREGEDYSVTGNISVATTVGLIVNGGSGASASAQIGHGGSLVRDSSPIIDGTFSGNITISTGGTTFLTGGAASRSYAQIGHGGYLSRGAKSGTILLDTVSLEMRSGNFNNSSTQIGHGGNLGALDRNYSGNITVNTTSQIKLTSGGAFDAFSQIGHGGVGRAGTTPVAFTGDIRITGQDLTMAMVSSGTSHVQIGHGGERAAGNHSGDISLNVRDLTMNASGQHSYMFLGHGGGDGNLSGDVVVRARDVMLWANNNNGTSAQIGHATAKGSMSGKTTVYARDLVLRAGGSSAWARIGMGFQGPIGTANATGDIVVNASNLTMIGGNSYSSPAKIGHGRIDPGVIQGDIAVTVKGETSLERSPNGSGASISHITTTRDGGILKSDWSLSTGTLDTSSTATATAVVLDSYLTSVFGEAGAFGNMTLTATGLNGDDGQLTLGSAYRGYSGYDVTFASSRDLTVNAPVSLPRSSGGKLVLLFGQAAGGTLILNSGAAPLGSSVAAVRGGSRDDRVILGNSGFLEADLDGGGGNNTLVGGDDSAAFTIQGMNRGIISAKNYATWQNFQNLAGGSGNDSFLYEMGGSLDGTISGGGGSNSLTGANENNLFRITGLNSGRLVGRNRGWSEIQKIQGGNLTDTLHLADGSPQTITVTGRNAGVYDLIGNGWSSIEHLVGGDADDTFALTTSNSSILSIAGAGGNNTLQVTEGANRISMTGPNAGNVVGKVTGWTGISTVVGGSGVDNFFIESGGSLSQTLDGGGGSDILTNRSGLPLEIRGVDAGLLPGGIGQWRNIENLVGGTIRITETGFLSGKVTSANELIADYQNAVFEFLAARTGTLEGKIAGGWFDIAKITGGPGDDLFRFGTGYLGGHVDGGGGYDTIVSLSPRTDFTIDGVYSGRFSQNTSGGFATFANISRLVGGSGNDIFRLTDSGVFDLGTIDGGAGSNLLDVSGTHGRTFTFTGRNSGEMTGLAGFHNISSVQAGLGEDTFLFVGNGSISGDLAGGGGIDTLDYSQFDYGVTVDLLEGSASQTGGVGQIERVIGSRYADTLSAGFDTILLAGNAGDDRFLISPAASGSAVEIIGGGGNNSLHFSTENWTDGADYQIAEGRLTRQQTDGPAQIWNFSDISSLEMLLGPESDTVRTSGLSFSQQLDGGAGLPNELIIDGAGYGLVDPTSPVVIGNNGEIRHLNFDPVTIVNAATPTQVRDILNVTTATYDLSARADLLRFLWFLDSGVQTRRHAHFHYLDKNGKPIQSMATAGE